MRAFAAAHPKGNPARPINPRLRAGLSDNPACPAYGDSGERPREHVRAGKPYPRRDRLRAVLYDAVFGEPDSPRTGKARFCQRLYTTPLTAADFIFGYVLPILPIALAQAVICYAFAAILGLKLGLNTVLAVLMLIPCALFFIALGLLCGSVMSTKQVGGICGALLTNLSAWLSGIWFDVEMVGKGFKSFCKPAAVYPRRRAGKSGVCGGLAVCRTAPTVGCGIYARDSCSGSPAVFAADEKGLMGIAEKFSVRKKNFSVLHFTISKNCDILLSP